MEARLSLIAALGIATLLSACGYGWEETPSVYPPSTEQAGAHPVVQGGKPLGPDEYLVQPGDTLYAIGFKNQLDWKDLAAWNHIGGEYRIHPGQRLRLTAPPEADDGVQVNPVVVAARPAGAPVAVPMPVPSPVPATGAPPVPAPAVVAQPLPTPAATPKPTITAPVVPVAPAAAGGDLRWSWPYGGKVVRGYNLAAGAKGIDIAGEVGQPVIASADGKVVYSGSALKGYGELVIIKHDDTYLSAYGYNRVRLVKEGDSVRAGQTIAQLGIGPEQKPVLHFEIREHGKPVDPMKFLPAN